MKYGDDKKEKLERLEKRLYSRNAPNIIDSGRSEFKQKNTMDDFDEPKEDWSDVKNDKFDQLAKKVSYMAYTKNSFVKKVLIFSIAFFVIAAGVAAFVFFGGVNMVSSKNVDIKVSGPLAVGGGQEVSLDINVINNNNVSLSSASLLVKYPDGTRDSKDLSKALTQERFTLGTVKSGESYSQNIKAVFFGEEKDTKQIQISLEYRVENSSALFYKDKSYEISIGSSPIIITPTYPKEVNSNQEMSLSIEVASNSKDKMNNFLMKVEYPSGFVFSGASPSASFGNNTWQLADLAAGEKRTIVIKGNLIGQDNEEKVFKINAGTASGDDERVIGIPFSNLTESVLIKKPFVNLGVSVGGSAGDYVGRGGERVPTEISVMNNLPAKLFNVSVQVSLSGGALNVLDIKPDSGGFFQSSDNTILWDKRSVESFSNIGPGSEEQLSFTLSPLLYANIAKGAKPEIDMTVTVNGEKINDSGSSETVSATQTRKIILGTDLSLTSKLARSLGNIENSGTVPPKANVPTDYTVIWSIANSFNQVSNVTVRATLPPYVKWANLKDPQSENFSQNQITNEVVWNAGSVLPSTGSGSSPKQIYFQLEFLPSLSQVGGSPIILGEATISGIDKITGQKIEFKVPALNTNFSGDPSFKQGDDRVVK
jgi:hypothetical protein